MILISPYFSKESQRKHVKIYQYWSSYSSYMTINSLYQHYVYFYEVQIWLKSRNLVIFDEYAITSLSLISLLDPLSILSICILANLGCQYWRSTMVIWPVDTDNSCITGIISCNTCFSVTIGWCRFSLGCHISGKVTNWSVSEISFSKSFLTLIFNILYIHR